MGTDFPLVRQRRIGKDREESRRTPRRPVSSLESISGNESSQKCVHHGIICRRSPRTTDDGLCIVLVPVVARSDWLRRAVKLVGRQHLFPPHLTPYTRENRWATAHLALIVNNFSPCLSPSNWQWLAFCQNVQHQPQPRLGVGPESLQGSSKTISLAASVNPFLFFFPISWSPAANMTPHNSSRSPPPSDFPASLNKNEL